MRLSSLLLPLLIFLAAAVGCVVAARLSVTVIEESSKQGVRAALDAEGMVWANVDADGLQIFLIGTAPSEAMRFRAMSAAGSVVDVARVIDQLNVADAARLTPPKFSIEILSNDHGVSLAGLIPVTTNRADIIKRLEDGVYRENSDGRARQVSDLMDAADYPEPQGWDASLEFALEALRALPRSKISVEENRVEIAAMVDSETERARKRAELSRKSPDGVQLALKISAPRPVITPFTLRFVINENGTRFDACSADTQETADRIARAANAAGLEGQFQCRIGLGVPSTRWAEATTKAIAALKSLGGGTVTFRDADISLIAREGTPAPTFDEVIGGLENDLPDVFALHAVRPVPEMADPDQDVADFIATLSPEGLVQLRGRIGSELSRNAVDSYASALFGIDAVRTTARLDGTLPADWMVRVLTGVEGLGHLNHGALIVNPDVVSLRGETYDNAAKSEIARLFAEKLGKGAAFDINVTYVERPDPVSEKPTLEQCEKMLQVVTNDRKISFEPGSANLASDALGIMNDLAEVLTECGDIRLEIAGHTDSQGREEMNLTLSQARAQSVLNALRERRVLTSTYTARGYGEASPIADNGTEEGRETNRRIEFRIIHPETAAEEETTLESTAGVVPPDGQSATSVENKEGSDSEQN